MGNDTGNDRTLEGKKRSGMPFLGSGWSAGMVSKAFNNRKSYKCLGTYFAKDLSPSVFDLVA